MVTYNPRGTRGSSESALAGGVNPVPPICELGGPRTSEVRKEEEEKKGDVKERMKEKAKNKGLGNSRPERVSRWESRAGRAVPMPCHTALLFPGDEQENEVLSTSRLPVLRSQSPGTGQILLCTHHPSPATAPEHCRRSCGVVLLECMCAASPELQLEWLSKESAHGNSNQLFPSSQQ